MSRVLDLTRELVARPSVTPDDAGCQRLVSERLLPLGFDVEWFLSGPVTNVLITRGRGSPSVWFLGHTDVVPPGPEERWTFLPFHPDEKNGELYGRGVADMKGAVAAMVVALETFAAHQPGQLGGAAEARALEGEAEAEAQADGDDQEQPADLQRALYPSRLAKSEPSEQGGGGEVARVDLGGERIERRVALKGRVDDRADRFRRVERRLAADGLTAQAASLEEAELAEELSVINSF